MAAKRPARNGPMLFFDNEHVASVNLLSGAAHRDTRRVLMH